MAWELQPLSDGRHRLAGELCIFHAAELKPALLALLSADGQCTLDLDGVSEVDTAGLQLLLLARQEAARAGCELRFANHSQPLREAIELLGLTAPLDLPATAEEGRDEPR